MTTAIVGTGVLGSAIARQLAAGGETLQLASADVESARKLAAQIGPSAVVAVDNGAALQDAEAVVLALRFTALQSVINEVTGSLGDKLVVVPSNPLTTDAEGHVVRVLAPDQSSGEVVSGWLPARARLTMAFGTMSADLFESSSHRTRERAVLFYVSDDDGRPTGRAVDPDGWLRARTGGRDGPIEPARGGWRSPQPRCRPHGGAGSDPRVLTPRSTLAVEQGCLGSREPTSKENSRCTGLPPGSSCEGGPT